MPRFLGYHDRRRPYLWYVDTDARTMEPSAAPLRSIPQGIDELVPLDACLAVRCGPIWFGLHRDLSGPVRALDPDEAAAAKIRSVQVDWPQLPSIHSPELHLPAAPGRAPRTVTHPAVDHWGREATLSPDRKVVAIAGSTVPFEEPAGTITEAMERPLVPQPHLLALIDMGTGAVTVCDGTFDGLCYPPTWSADGSLIAFGAPYEPKRVYVVDRQRPVLEPITFKRLAPMPLVDAALLDAD